jgi:uncharacterized protein YkwD
MRGRLYGLLFLTSAMICCASQGHAADAAASAPATANTAAEAMIRAALAPRAPGEPDDQSSYLAEFADRMVAAVNAVRAQRGLSPVTIDPTLSHTAQDLANDLSQRHEVSHEDNNGAHLGTRLAQHGYAFNRAVENVAGGLDVAEYVVQLWTASPEHARNLFNPVVCQAGVGFVELDPSQSKGVMPSYWVLDMAQPMSGGCH